MTRQSIVFVRLPVKQVFQVFSGIATILEYSSKRELSCWSVSVLLFIWPTAENLDIIFENLGKVLPEHFSQEADSIFFFIKHELITHVRCPNSISPRFLAAFDDKSA